MGLAGERGYEGPNRDPGCGELLLRAELGVEEVPGPREAALGTMTQAPSPQHSGLLSELLLNSALRGRQSGLPKASTTSLPLLCRPRPITSLLWLASHQNLRTLALMAATAIF